MNAQPPEGRLVREIDVSAFGGPQVNLADVNDDGRLEILTHQSPGQFKADIDADGRTDVDEHDRALHCVTALTLDGEVLWQHGTPWDRDYPYTCHGAKGMLRVDDFDADGRAEVAVIVRDELVLLDGHTGREQARTKLPADNYAQIWAAQLDGPGKPKQLVLKVNNRGYPPWTYANPVLVLEADLSVRREPFEVRGAGHNVIAEDLDGDGRDELLIGYSYLDDDLTERWRLELGEDFDYIHDHADQIRLDTDEQGRRQVIYSGGDEFMAADLEGNLLWRTRAGHSQGSVAGRWGPDGETRIIMSEKNLGLWGMDAAGEVLWNRKDINGYATGGVRWAREPGRTSWCAFQPQLRPFKELPFTSDPSWSRGLWPSFIDGDGDLLDVFGWRDEYAQPPRHIRASRSYDAGVVYNICWADVDDDGLEEVFISNRDRVRVFHSEA